jgi:O-acetyl-ADP-ribose deacetylase (regulator of RNase III)
MSLSKTIGNTELRLETGDITDFEVEAFVFYAREDLKLGSGFGNAIAVRGGPQIQKQLDELGGGEVGDVFVTDAGNMKAQYILHAVGPKFMEEDLEAKLARTMQNVLKTAEEKGIKQIAFPAMGAGFYGVPLDVCARVMIEEIKRHVESGTKIEEVIIKVLDKREYQPFAEVIEKLN